MYQRTKPSHKQGSGQGNDNDESRDLQQWAGSQLSSQGCQRGRAGLSPFKMMIVNGCTDKKLQQVIGYHSCLDYTLM